MFRPLHNRFGHYLLLIVVWACLGLPDLGGPTLWDIDEGNNAEAARMMLVSGDYVVPTFNGDLRVDKPALLYWLQVGAYRLFGVNEFAARFPSALAVLVTILFAYELARKQFGPGCGLLTGLVLTSSVAFCMCGHFANPDALLLACSVAGFYFFWLGFTGERLRFVSMGVAFGLGVLAKGPVGLVLPAAVIVLFLIWSGGWRKLLDWRICLGLGAFLAVVLPWYAWVAAETKMDFIRGFILLHNVQRYLTPLENHTGPVWYYLPVMFIGFMPWAVMMGLGCWFTWPFSWNKREQDTSSEGERQAHRFLWCWVLLYLVFFTGASTKLPNYILPVYVPLAVFMGYFLNRWRTGAIVIPNWMMACGMVYLALVGVGFGVGLMVGSGRLTLPVLDEPPIAGLDRWAPIGLVMLLGAAAGAWFLWKQNRSGVVVAISVAGIVFVGLLAGGAVRALEGEKSPEVLARAWQREQSEREVRVGCYQYFLPSLVFYSRHDVDRLFTPHQVREFLRSPLEVYLCVPEPVWNEELEKQFQGRSRVIARRHDLYHKCDILIVTNR